MEWQLVANSDYCNLFLSHGYSYTSTPRVVGARRELYVTISPSVTFWVTVGYSWITKVIHFTPRGYSFEPTTVTVTIAPQKVTLIGKFLRF